MCRVCNTKYTVDKIKDEPKGKKGSRLKNMKPKKKNKINRLRLLVGGVPLGVNVAPSQKI